MNIICDFRFFLCLWRLYCCAGVKPLCALEPCFSWFPARECCSTYTLLQVVENKAPDPSPECAVAPVVSYLALTSVVVVVQVVFRCLHALVCFRDDGHYGLGQTLEVSASRGAV